MRESIIDSNEDEDNNEVERKNNVSTIDSNKCSICSSTKEPVIDKKVVGKSAVCH